MPVPPRVVREQVVEEKFIGGWNIPALLVVGTEGVFGFTMLSLITLALNFVPMPKAYTSSAGCDSHGVPYPAPPATGATIQGLQQLSNPIVLGAMIGNIISIA
jgi:hypothetical protein